MLVLGVAEKTFRIRTTSPLAVDAYRDNRTMGSFILVDEATNETAAGGMIEA
jgi:sulfate adenylyltransferase subunit 1